MAAEFAPADDCPEPDFCEDVMHQCRQAAQLKHDLGFAIDYPDHPYALPPLKMTRDNTVCSHPQAQEALGDANEFLQTRT